MKGRQHELALAQVLGAIEQQHGAVPHHRAEHGVGLAGTQHLRGAAEDLLDELRLEDHHEAGIEEAAERHDVAVAPSARVDESSRDEDEAERLKEARQGRAGGHQRGRGGHHDSHNRRRWNWARASSDAVSWGKAAVCVWRQTREHPDRRSRSGCPSSSELKARCRRHHGRATRVHGGDDLLDVDALEVDAGGAEAGVSELALDDVQRHALAGELDRMRMT